MTDDEFEGWLATFSMDQKISLHGLRALITKHTESLCEEINHGKWLTNYVFYTFESTMVYAIGPKGKSKTSLHMMPYYGSAALQEKYRPTLSPYLTGKSCIAFRNFNELPGSSVIGILEAGTPAFLRSFSR